MWFGFWRICNTLFPYRLSDQFHLRHKDSILPNRDPEHRRIPDVPFVNWKQPPFVIRHRRACKRITDDDIPRHSKQTHLQIAHHAHDVVDVLRYKQHIRLIIDAFLSAFVCERHQQGPSAAGRITDRNPSPISDFLLEFFCRGRYCGHELTQVVWRKELSCMVVSKPQAHIQLAKEVLFRVVL